jgi:hypothetical protein
MKKVLATLISAALLAGVAFAAQHGNRRKPAQTGKLATTGMDNAENKANANGVNNGIENAEAKQDKHKKANTAKAKHSKKKISGSSSGTPVPAPAAKK